MFTQKFQAWVRRWAERFVGVFRESPITPNMLTLFGLVITGVGALLVAVNQLLLGGLVLTVAGFFDVFDGALARASGKIPLRRLPRLDGRPLLRGRRLRGDPDLLPATPRWS